MNEEIFWYKSRLLNRQKWLLQYVQVRACVDVSQYYAVLSQLLRWNEVKIRTGSSFAYQDWTNESPHAAASVLCNMITFFLKMQHKILEPPRYSNEKSCLASPKLPVARFTRGIWEHDI